MLAVHCCRLSYWLLPAGPVVSDCACLPMEEGLFSCFLFLFASMRLVDSQLANSAGSGFAGNRD